MAKKVAERHPLDIPDWKQSDAWKVVCFRLDAVVKSEWMKAPKCKHCGDRCDWPFGNYTVCALCTQQSVILDTGVPA